MNAKELNAKTKKVIEADIENIRKTFITDLTEIYAQIEHASNKGKFETYFFTLLLDDNTSYIIQVTNNNRYNSDYVEDKLRKDGFLISTDIKQGRMTVLWKINE